MIPHVIVLEPGLVIFKIYNGYWFFGRPTVEELRQDLRAVLKKCRPDWDITRPELKAAWEHGERDRFYPYGKTYGQVFREQDWDPARDLFLAQRLQRIDSRGTASWNVTGDERHGAKQSSHSCVD
jgi:hypothetical protein